LGRKMTKSNPPPLRSVGARCVLFLRLQSAGMGVEHECRCLGTCLGLLFNALYLPLLVRYLVPIERGGTPSLSENLEYGFCP
jgi:hypothetical protein